MFIKKTGLNCSGERVGGARRGSRGDCMPKNKGG